MHLAEELYFYGGAMRMELRHLSWQAGELRAVLYLCVIVQLEQHY